MTPRELLAAYHRAMLDSSPDDLADLYAEDAVHEFPFAAPGFPAAYHGREEIRAGYRETWHDHPVHFDEIHDVVVYDVGPDVVIGQWAATGSLNANGKPVTVTGLLALHCADGQLVHVRDYMDALGVATALDRLPATITFR